MYNITNYTKQKTRELNVKIKPSSNPKKKIDVYKDNKKIASVGAIGYKDYPTYLKADGKYELKNKKVRKLEDDK